MSGYYDGYVNPYRTIWITFGLMLMSSNTPKFQNAVDAGADAPASDELSDPNLVTLPAHS